MFTPTTDSGQQKWPKSCGHTSETGPACPSNALPLCCACPEPQDVGGLQIRDSLPHREALFTLEHLRTLGTLPRPQHSDLGVPFMLGEHWITLQKALRGNLERRWKTQAGLTLPGKLTSLPQTSVSPSVTCVLGQIGIFKDCLWSLGFAGGPLLSTAEPHL